MISELPLFLFTTIAGLAAGAAATRALFPLSKERKNPWLPLLVILALLGIGLVCVLFHLGRPERFVNGLANPQAGIAQEAYFAILFGILLLIELILVFRKGESPRGLGIATGVAALCLTFVMGNAYVGNYGIPAWSDAVTIPMYVFGDLAMGAALYAVFEPQRLGEKGFFAAMVVIEVLAMLAMGTEAAHFGAVGLDGGAFIAAAVLCGPAAFVVTLLARRKPTRTWAVVLFVIMLVGVVAARWTFYGACVL